MRLIEQITRRGLFMIAAFAMVMALSQLAAVDAAADVRPPDGAVDGAVPGNAEGNTSDSDIWRAVRGGVQGQVSIPDKQAGVLVQ